MQLLMQFVYFLPGQGQRLFAAGGDAVHSPPTPTGTLLFRPQKTGTFQPVQQRIERSRANAVAVVRKFLHHSQTKERFM